METTSPIQPGPYTRREWLQLGLFWSWNLIFLAFMSLGFAPTVLPMTITAARTGTIPPSFLVYALVLATIPVAAVILGLTILRRSPSRLFALGYVIEGPLMLMLAVRFFLIRQSTPGTLALMAIAALGMAGYLWTLLDPKAGERRPLSESLRLASLTLMALTSLYAAAWITFYALPLSVEIGRVLVDFLANLPQVLGDLGRTLLDMLRDMPLMLPFSVLGFILLLYTATLFVLTPLAVPYLSLRAWWQALIRQADRLRGPRPLPLVAAVLAACAIVFFLANRQPQAAAFALLANPPSSAEEAESLLDRSAAIRAGLLNAYLAPFRYLSAEGEVRHVSDIYTSAFHLPYSTAYAIQRLYEGLARPLLYQPVHPPDKNRPVDNRALVEEPREAARLYQRFFDAPITEVERPTIVRAVRSTWSINQAEEAWLAYDDREVHLVRQELYVQEHGDWAGFELHEAYQNQTAEQQEVIYYFNLPESAVLTGVWLGNSPEKELAESFQVAQRGAAQAVYREQTRVNQDPALLEQIGPRQYRLRIFPIPPVQVTYDGKSSRTFIEEAPLLYMWLAWQQMVDDGAWRMPQLAFLRNVFWDAATERVLNGEPAEVEGDDWLPETLPAAQPFEPQVHQVDLPGGKTVLAIPSGIVEPPALPSGLRLGVVIDRSRSMEAHAGEVSAALQRLKAMDRLEAPVDVYLTASPYRGEAPSVAALEALDPQQIVYFGGQNAAQLIAQFDSLYQANRPGRTYDALIILTDGSGYELGVSEVEAPVPTFPVWVVHLGEEVSLGYDDGTLQAIQVSGGGVAGSVEEALLRLAVALSTPDSQTAPTTSLVDGYVWQVLSGGQIEAALPPEAQVQVHTATDPYAAIAARQLILAEMQRQRGSIDQVETLDALHALAANYGIVTPYSSMIVLVNSRQQELLEHLSQADDRYEREVEALGETTPATPLPLAGVPEPHEWLLLGLAAAFLGYLILKKRTQVLQSAQVLIKH